MALSVLQKLILQIIYFENLLNLLLLMSYVRFTKVLLFQPSLQHNLRTIGPTKVYL